MEKNKRWQLTGLSALSGFLLWLAWPPLPTGFIIFVAFVPLFFVLDRAYAYSKKSGPATFLLAYLALSIWNALTTWWIWYASPAGALMAILLNALLMALVVWLAYRVRRFSGSRFWWYAALITLWVCYEHIHFNWDAPWPWLALGNVFATLPDWVQWFEYTGIQGGTLWIWAVNIYVYEMLRSGIVTKKLLAKKETQSPGIIESGPQYSEAFLPVTGLLVLVTAPILLSYQVRPELDPKMGFRRPPGNIVVVQPNIDPYNDKFDPATLNSQVETLINLSEKTIDKNTRLVLWPETAIAEDIAEDQLHFYPTIQNVKRFLTRNPHVKLITGTTSYTIYQLHQQRTATARLFVDKSAYYDVFNSALLLDTGKKFEVYHKSKLVPGVEKMPYPEIFSFLEPLAIDLGGTTGSMGSQDSATVFRIDSQIIAAPVICYESVFGDYVGDYINQGANIIAVITNDGWWDNSNGYKQHRDYAVLRAIETRRFIARSANTGISCFITPDGEIKHETNWWEPAAIKSGIILNDELTFYVRHGDYIAYILRYAGLAFIFIALFGWILRPFLARKKKIKTGM